jgi:hypothetical protein
MVATTRTQAAAGTPTTTTALEHVLTTVLSAAEHSSFRLALEEAGVMTITDFVGLARADFSAIRFSAPTPTAADADATTIKSLSIVEVKKLLQLIQWYWQQATPTFMFWFDCTAESFETFRDTAPTSAPKSCIICNAVASPDLQLQYCAQCQSALYCSKACQRRDWKQRQHKQICKFLIVGHGDRQVRTENHTSQQIELKEYFELEEGKLHEYLTQFFKLFTESTFEGSRAAAREMKEFAKQQIKTDQKYLLFHSIRFLFLIRSIKSEMLSWPNSPLLVMLQLVDPNVLDGDEDLLEEGDVRQTLLVNLGDLTDPFDYSTHVNQLIVAKQLIEHGANINAVSIPDGMTPLHRACCSGNVTNLDFVELLLEAGADPNAQDHLGRTPLIYTIPSAPGAAKFLLNWPTTDANIATRSGASFLASIRKLIRHYSGRVALPDNSDRIQDQFLLQRWSEIEEMLVERGAVDTGITVF